MDIPREAFFPAPSVCSSVLLFLKREEGGALDFFKFKFFLEKFFSQKRRSLSFLIKTKFSSEERFVLQKRCEIRGVNLNLRPHQISADIYQDFFLHLESYLNLDVV